jgi:hypothetical protein
LLNGQAPAGTSRGLEKRCVSQRAHILFDLGSDRATEGMAADAPGADAPTAICIIIRHFLKNTMQQATLLS